MSAANPGWTRAPWAGVPTLPRAAGDGAQALAEEAALQTILAGDDVPWRPFFSSAEDVDFPGRGVFRVYCAASPGAAADAPLLVLLHGFGCAALSWAPAARHLLSAAPCRVAAADLRGHGATAAQPEELDADTLLADVVALARALALRAPAAPLVLVGHSLGGALAARASAQLPGLAGLVLVDCLEEAALRAPPPPPRPPRFADRAEALRWALRQGAARCAAGAAPGLAAALRPLPEGGLGWRTAAAEQTRALWAGWFGGVTDAFLASVTPRLLLLGGGGAERLDARLAVAQMQGRFQLAVLPRAGHAVQEDEPAATATALAAFLQRIVLPRLREGRARSGA